jgi:uncharacterized membrane protein
MHIFLERRWIMAKSLGDIVGGWAFLIGVVLAVIIGFFPAIDTPTTVLVLIVIGIIVGLLNVGDKEVMPFLLSGLTLVLVGRFGGDALADIIVIGGILNALMIIFVPATVIVAIKNVLSLAKR